MSGDLKNYVLGRGKVYFDPFAVSTKNKTGERYFGNTTEFNLTIESDKLDHFASDEGVKTKDDSVILELNRTGNMTTDNIATENAALFVLGDQSVVTQVSTPVTDESLGGTAGVVLPDRYYQLGATSANPQGVRNVGSVSLTHDPSGTSTPLVLDTDYELDEVTGRVYFLDTSAIVNGTADVQADYTPAAETRDRITTSAAASVEGALRFIAFNAKGKQKDFYFPFVTLTPTGDWALKGDDWQSMAFSVEVGELTGQAAIYIDGRAE